MKEKKKENKNNVATRSMRLAGMDPFLDNNSDASPAFPCVSDALRREVRRAQTKHPEIKSAPLQSCLSQRKVICV